MSAPFCSPSFELIFDSLVNPAFHQDCAVSYASISSVELDNLTIPVFNKTLVAKTENFAVLGIEKIRVVLHSNATDGRASVTARPQRREASITDFTNERTKPVVRQMRRTIRS